MIYWPVVQQRLVALLPTLTGFTDVVVHDGPPLSEQGAESYVTVGWSEDSGSGSFVPTDEAITGMRAETGTVLCEFVIWGGDEDLPGYRATAFDLVDALEESIRTEGGQRLAVLPASSTTSLSADVVSAQDSSGATQRLLVSVNYFVRS